MRPTVDDLVPLAQKTAREAMDGAQRKWERIIKRQKRNGIIDAIKASRTTWPTIVDPA